MSRVLLGVLLLGATVARAQGNDEERMQTVGDAVRDCVEGGSQDDLAPERLSDGMATAPAVAPGAPDGLSAMASGNSASRALAAAPWQGSEFGRVSAAADGTAPWDIRAALGFTLTDGNSDTITLAAGADAKREWTLWKLAMALKILYAETDGDQSASEWIFFERLERKLSERATIFQDLLLEHDEEENLNYRIQLTLGYNRRLVKKGETFELWGNVGGGVLYEDFFTGSDTEGIAQLGINFTWQITKILKYTQVITFYPSLSNGGEFRMYWESVLTTPLGERLDLRLAIIDRYDSDAQAGVEKNDLTIALTLQIRFTKEPPK